MGGGGAFGGGKKQGNKKPKPKKQHSSAFYDDDHFETEKPKIAPTRRRQITSEKLLNDLFGSIVDSCVIFDKEKIFHQRVKAKDAPNYYEHIKNPMELQTMKQKTKRLAYSTLQEFQDDLALIRANAELYNGYHSYIGDSARHLEEYAIGELQKVESDIQNLEQSIRENPTQI